MLGLNLLVGKRDADLPLACHSALFRNRPRYDGARGVLTLTALPENPATRSLECAKSNYGRKGWGAVLHECTTDAGDFAGLEFRGEDGDRINDVRTWMQNHKGSARNGRPSDTDFMDVTPTGKNPYE